MTEQPDGSRGVAVVAGFGPGLGEALSRRLIGDGFRVAGLSRSGSAAGGAAERFAREVAREDARENGGTGRVFRAVACDVADPAAVAAAVADVEAAWGGVTVYVHNASRLILKPFLETTPAEFEDLWRITCLGAVNGARAVLPGMLTRGGGVLVFVGATASVKAGPRSAAFAAAKFALRGLAQSLARAHGRDGIHVAHLVIDGVIFSERARTEWGMAAERCLSADAVAATCLAVIHQDRSAWTLELDLRPDVESF